MKKSPAILSIGAGYKLKNPPREGAAGEYALLEDIIRNHSSDFPDVCASLKLKLCDITIGECQNKFAIRDDFGKARGLHGESLLKLIINNPSLPPIAYHTTNGMSRIIFRIYKESEVNA